MFAAGDFDGWLKFIHVLFAILWVGGGLLVGILGMRMQKANPERVIHFTEHTQVGGRVFSISGAVILIAGVWLVARVDFWEFSQAWISIGFLGVAVGFVLGIAFYAPQARLLITAIKENDPAAGAIAKRIGMVSTLELVLLVVVVWAMVFKPGL